jgi:HupE / UreJ protein
MCFFRISPLFIVCLVTLLGLRGFVYAHPMPNSVVVLNIHEKHYTGQIQLPLGELQTAIGMAVNDDSNRLIERLGDSLKKYLIQHIRPKSFEGKPWSVTLGAMKVVEIQNPISGTYKELVINFEMSPPQNHDLRNFYFDYDVILHQVASHQVLVALKEDWQRGIVSEDSSSQQVGVIAWDIPSGTIKPFQISLEAGSTWRGFQKMCSLGIKHISEGTDHLLFVLTLLLSIIKPTTNKDTYKTVLKNILKIITAFTVGHSLTLLVGSLGWVRPPSQIIEILIAVSILISAIHALKPIFAGREIFVAAGFGLIHGLAFANTLVNLSLTPKYMFLSILGFNIGIELMQLVIIALTIPWLMLLSQAQYYSFLSRGGAVVVAVAAVAWLFERITEKPNTITVLIEHLAAQAHWLLLGLALVSVLSYYKKTRTFES